MTKFTFELGTVEKHYVIGKLTTCERCMCIHNFYLPPAGSKRISMTDIERLGEIGDMNIGM